MQVYHFNSFKVNEMDDLSTISPNIAFSYLLLWDCILNFCSLAPAELRSIYARWITAHQFEEVNREPLVTAFVC
jgi:E3 ubiquitin-protein ligase listerin